MRTRTKVLLVGTAVAGAAAIPAIAYAGNGSSDGNEVDVPITGPALEEASQAALSHLGEGTVTGTEVGDEESYYEVEVTLDDGSQVDVQLDEEFRVVGSDQDGTGPDD